MLHRAASNAYSWWWASHIRTKQSKWLEQNLQDMEEKVGETLKIINNDGDSFAQRAEMYYRKRPELINYVEECYRSYRALAERYDHLSRDLQRANRTIATVYPEQVQFAIDDEDEQNLSTTSTSFNIADKPSEPIPKPSIPKVPKMKKDFRIPSMLLSRKGQQLKRNASTAKAATPPSSGLTKNEALEELDKLQKEILTLQTEREFVKSSYERGYEKFCEIENQITEMQGRVCSLQDEFGIGTAIEDNEARTLMASTALNSCKKTLDQLKEKEDQSAEEAEMEHERAQEAQEKFQALRRKFLPKQTEQEEAVAESRHEGSRLANFSQESNSEEPEKHDLELLRKKIKEQLDVESDSTITVSQLAEKIDGLVNTVVTLETAVSSQAALVERLRTETDELQAHIRTLEEDKESLIEGSENTNKKLKELEDELQRVKSLNRSFKDQNNSLQVHFTEAICNIDHLSGKLHNVKLDEEVENVGLFQEMKVSPVSKPVDEVKNHGDKLAPADDSKVSQDTNIEKEEKKEISSISDSVKGVGEDDIAYPSITKHDFVSKNRTDLSQDDKNDNKDLPGTEASSIDIKLEEMGSEEEEGQPNWRQLYLNGLEDREKLLLDDYSSVLHNYKEVKRKLADVEKKNRDGFFELAMQMRELKNAIASRDEEIRSLRQKQSSPNINMGGQWSSHSHQEGTPESITQVASSPESNISSLTSNQQPPYYMLGEQRVESGERTDKLDAAGELKRSAKEEERETKIQHFHSVPSPVEEKFRSEIDELLEENLEFWLRFSTSFHQIRKFQTSIHDLKAELLQLKDGRKQEGSGKNESLTSVARPIYKHLREIETELSLWLENNSVMKDEMQGRYDSLCNIQEEISTVSSGPEKTEITEYKAAKFQGEVLNMKQENRKVTDELHAGLDKVRAMQLEVETTLAKLDEDFGISASKQNPNIRSSSLRARIPLRSFLFGMKLKKQRQQKASLFSCMSPALQKQYSTLAEVGVPQSR
ncbi:hypothetical protein HS088_TW11G00212 [Tripterygium wilfordii]|uniref:NAB domain-containing protein n=1 Tax=Tripterygium wilfordii TaxID=458696 RepID=A0A7J7D249_TRIWF|nr:protein NETWORKED 2A [Tripterygium wilfordii]KAF5740146.1 hypothetical protein HS088_TW11G00212 [Tripterygium wilfordii]